MRYKNTGRRRRKKKHTLRNLTLTALAVTCLALAACYCFRISPEKLSKLRPSSIIPEQAPLRSPFLPEGTPDELMDLLKHNEETYDFVQEYVNREEYLSQTVDLADDPDVAGSLAEGEVPLLMQWDLRWGYAPYGEDMVGLAGCGPTCLSMAYIYLTGDTSMHPAAMAKFAYEHGFYTEYGTDWALWTDGAALLGLLGETISLEESAMKDALRNGVIVCSMRPGDFTTTGHFILIRGYDENGFYVNDPNRRSNSARQWTFEELSRQIKNLWRIW